VVPDPVVAVGVAVRSAAPPAGPARDPASIRRVAHDILSRPEFQPPPQSLLDRLRHWVGHQISRAIDAALSGNLTVIGSVLLIAIAVLVVYLVVRATRGVHRDPTLRGVVVGGRSRPPADWLAEAADCERRGDWRGALRARYRATVAELARRGLLDEVPGRTTGEYREEVAGSLPGSSGDFTGATDLFERAVYGHLPTGPEEAGRLRELTDRVLVGAQ